MERKIQEQESTIKKEEFVIKPTFKPRQNQLPRSYDEVTYDWHDHTEHILVFFSCHVSVKLKMQMSLNLELLREQVCCTGYPNTL